MARLAVVQPPVKRTLDARSIHHLPSHSQMRTHVQTICLQRINHSILPSVDDHVLASHVNVLHLSLLELVRLHDVVPSVGVWRGRLPDVFFVVIVLPLEEEVWRPKANIVEGVESEDAQY